MQRARTLEVDEDLDFQRGEWRVARVTWGVLLGLMVATALGLFGDGVLSRARAGEEGDPLWVEYDRFSRFGAAARFEVHVRADADGAARFELGRKLLEAYQVLALTPEPASTRLRSDALELRFDAEPNADVSVLLEVQPARRFRVEGVIRSAAAEVRVRQLVYP